MNANYREAPIYRFFAGLTESAFYGRLGVADPRLVEYVSELLVRFIRFDAIYRIRSLSGRRLEEVAEMLWEAEQRVGVARREVHRQIGDFTLFWTGLYPESLRKMRSQMKKDHFIDYCEQGKRSYHIASTYRDGKYADESAVLERLSQQFELCAFGLRQVRKEWENSDEDARPDSPLLLD